MLRRIVCWLMILSVPKAVLGEDVQGAMLYGKGTVWINGKPLPGPSAVLAGDSVETEASSAGNISVPGSSITVQQGSLVKFEVSSVTLERGTVGVITTKSVRVQAEKVSATPTSNDQTDFEVSNTEGKVRVTVRKGEVEVNCGKQVAKVPEGQEVSPDDQGHCKKRAYAALSKGPLANPWLWGGAAAAGGIIGIVIGISGAPISPSAPSPP
jgi:hypothetical protein